jgi:hypothetical protein
MTHPHFSCEKPSIDGCTLHDAAIEMGEPPNLLQEGGKRLHFYGKRGT